ncbi:hypothetical protein EET67_05030 [Pseudaminobacter arsenicus]|uniref:Siphovirus Gp157 family protein n=1 Tax=Borborobacter arsenicus TaxID=1851146 RepID=A0A432VA65_9HYPH|nr:siphovirus Gp157 family protein [Pseudaminobacter arsenicus]RUM99006.1 hypothetical protein EET67_05030 [Pseudaminobacter arsenicus]
MTANYLQADVANVLADIDALLTAYPELADDEDLRRDMLEGSTAAYDVLQRLVNQALDAETLTKATAGRITELQARKARYERKSDAMRALMFKVLKAIGERRATLPEATLSLRATPARVEIVDEALLPADCVRVSTSPDKTKIKELLAANQNVPGARMGEAGETISVKVA